MTTVALTEKDTKTLAALRGLARRAQLAAENELGPELNVPIRSLSNVSYSRKKRRLELGTAKAKRELFNVGQAKSFMQTILVSSGCKQLIDQGKTTSLRGLYYMLKHTIAGTREETFDEQAESDTVVEDVELLLSSMREELHLYASNRGGLAGAITIVDNGDEIDCTRMGTGGYSIPSIVEPEVVQFKDCKANFILHVEKDTVWRRFNEDKFWRKHHCLLTHGGGQPPRGVRRMLHRLHTELQLPVYCLLDNDPWGYYIYSVIKQGSINLAHESERMAIPNARYLGIRSRDFVRCKLSRSVQIGLSDQDIKRVNQIAEYPWFKFKPAWQAEIELMKNNGFKLEVESLISKGISFVTEEYVPQRLAEEDYLD